jgi:hypothetical protein
MYWATYGEQLKSGDTPVVQISYLRYEIYHTASALAVTYEHGNKTLVPTKGGEFLKYLSNNYLLTEDRSVVSDKWNAQEFSFSHSQV